MLIDLFLIDFFFLSSMMPGMASSIPPAVSEFPPGVRNERRGEEEEEEEEEDWKELGAGREGRRDRLMLI